MSNDTEPELPWGEAKWEQFMRESDARSARYGELLETLMDHPDRDAIIEKEMGWDREEEVDDRPFWLRDEDDPALLEELNREPTEEEIAETKAEHDKIYDIPAYKESFDWSMRVFHALKGQGENDVDVGELVGEAIGEGHCIAAKIAGGHGIGYEDESICGNIVNCKRSLEAADNSLRALSELGDLLPGLYAILQPLIADGRQVRQLVLDRIEELRSRVWWE